MSSAEGCLIYEVQKLQAEAALPLGQTLKHNLWFHWVKAVNEFQVYIKIIKYLDILFQIKDCYKKKYHPSLISWFWYTFSNLEEDICK